MFVRCWENGCFKGDEEGGGGRFRGRCGGLGEYGRFWIEERIVKSFSIRNRSVCETTSHRCGLI